MKIEKTDNIAELEDILGNIYQQDDIEKDTDKFFNWKKFGFVIKNDEGKIVGGIHGHRMFKAITIDELCMSKECRGNGLGRQLLEMAEKEGNDDGTCDNINLMTNAFQDAVEFYKKCGFEIEFIREMKGFPQLNKIYMVKKL
ncbi:MAG: hypothetical protein Ta2D_03710 [Rickettsiales bacterium]|nr:MAG: hypothetical protein Ta2D_03710 [Rickettsiales bacterium]